MLSVLRLYTIADRIYWIWSSSWNENWQQKSNCLDKTCPSATLSGTNPTFDTSCHVILMNIDRFWIDGRIYWTLWYSAWLHFTIHCYTNTLVSTVISSLSLPDSGSNGGCSPSSGFANWPRPQLPASNNNSSQRLNRSSPVTHSLTHSLTNQLFTNSLLVLLITCWHCPHRKHCSFANKQVCSIVKCA
jgi:hypothetical protein